MESPSIRPARPEDAPAIARVQVATWRHAYREIVPEAFIESRTVEERTALWGKYLAEPAQGATNFVFVAEGEGAVVGFANGGPNRGTESGFPGELRAIYILPEWQRRGIGERLSAAVVDRLRGAGFVPFLIWVLQANAPARAFYEKLGGRLAFEKTIDMGRPLVEVAYAFGEKVV